MIESAARARRRSARHASIAALLAALACGARGAPFEDTMAQRVLACTGCHGAQGRAGVDGYYPRLAGKPAGYLFNQLLHFRDGRRRYELMAGLLAPLGDAYLREIAAHFASLELPYPAPAPAHESPAVRAAGERLVRSGDPGRGLPACTACHGDAMTGRGAFVPGLLGLPRDYLNAQLGAWRGGTRRAHRPDCMAQIATRLAPEEIGAISSWLAAQPVPPHGANAPASADPAGRDGAALPMACGGGAGTASAPPR